MANILFIMVVMLDYLYCCCDCAGAPAELFDSKLEPKLLHCCFVPSATLIEPSWLVTAKMEHQGNHEQRLLVTADCEINLTFFSDLYLICLFN